MKAGLAALATTLGITQMTAASFGALLAAFNAALGTYNSARSDRQAASNLYHGKVDDLVVWLKVVRGILTGDFGDHWNTMWAQAGFVQPSTAIPRRLQDKIALSLKLAQFFTTSPQYEVSEKDVTAAKATELHDAIVAAQDPLQTANVALKTAEDALKAAQSALVAKMRFLIKILSGTLTKDDPRWQAFGLNIPATPSTPAAPTGLHATVMGANVLLECDPSALGKRYRFRGRIVGLETEYKLVATSRVPMALVKDAPSGVTVDYIVQAVNQGSQSKPSDPVSVTIPSAVAQEAAAKPAISEAELAPLTAIAPNSNGNGNGSHAISRLS